MMQQLINMIKRAKRSQRYAVLTFALIWLIALLDFVGCPTQFVGAAMLSFVVSAMMTIVTAGSGN